MQYAKIRITTITKGKMFDLKDKKNHFLNQSEYIG